MKNLRHLALFLTESCNLACDYCFAANMEHRYIDEELARQAVDLLFAPDNTSKQVALSFWGGEPLLRFETLKRLVTHAEERAAEQSRKILFSLPSNVTLLTEEMVDFLQSHRVAISLSLDGDEPSQSLRRTAGGQSSFPLIQEKLRLIHRCYGKKLPGVRMTVSPATAGDFWPNVRFFLDQGFGQVYFAPVVEADWSAEALSAFEQGQLELADHWCERLLAGERISFNTWDKILAWRELRRRNQLDEHRRYQCGAGHSMVAVDIYGDIYPCHRFVFYDKSQRSQALGSIQTGVDAERLAAYHDLDEPRLGTADTRCIECDDHDQCIVLCPALNYTLGGDIYRVDERLCRFSRMDRRIVDHLETRLGDADAFRKYQEFLLKVLAPGGLSASISALFRGFSDEDASRLADRADEIYRRLQAQRKPGP